MCHPACMKSVVLMHTRWIISLKKQLPMLHNFFIRRSTWNADYNTTVILLLMVSIWLHTNYKFSLHKTCSGETWKIAIQKMSDNRRLTLIMKQLKSTAREEFSVGLLAIGKYPGLLWNLQFGHCCPLQVFCLKVKAISISIQALLLPSPFGKRSDKLHLFSSCPHSACAW